MEKTTKKKTENAAAVAFVIVPEPEPLTDRQILNRLHKIADAERRKKQADDEIQALRAEIIAGRESIAMDTDSFSLKYTPVESSRIDSKRLREELPDVAAKYTTVTTSARFSYKIR